MKKMSEKAMQAQMAEQEKRWRTEADLNTLIEAERLKTDSERMGNVKALIKERRDLLDNLKVD